MSDELGEAAGAILGIAFGGFILIKMAAELNSTGPVNLAAWGTLLLISAVLATALLVFGAVNSIMR